MTLERIYELMLEASRRDFLKKMFGTAASTGLPIPGADTAKSLFQAASPVKRAHKFKLMFVGRYRGEFNILDITPTYGDNVSNIIKGIVDMARTDDYEANADDHMWNEIGEDENFDWDANGDDIEEYENEFIDVGYIDEESGLASCSVNEEEGYYVIRDDNPLYNLLGDATDGEELSPEQYQQFEQEINKWEDNMWEKSPDHWKNDPNHPSNQIEYSRSDYAGGSEDEGYAQYWESMKQSYINALRYR